MAAVTLNFLRVFRVTRDGVPITRFRGDKVRALLTYLATEADRPHSRAALAALLWPDQADDAALRNLSQTLLRLRQALGDTEEQPVLFDITRGTIEWRGDAARVDVLDFTRLARSTEPIDLEQASFLYLGDFLPGFDLPDVDTFEEWLMLTRAHLHQQALTVLRSLADHYLAQRCWSTTAETVDRHLALDPWREVSHRQLMRAARRGGRSCDRTGPV